LIGRLHKLVIPPQEVPDRPKQSALAGALLRAVEIERDAWLLGWTLKDVRKPRPKVAGDRSVPVGDDLVDQLGKARAGCQTLIVKPDAPPSIGVKQSPSPCLNIHRLALFRAQLWSKPPFVVLSTVRRR